MLRPALIATVALAATAATLTRAQDKGAEPISLEPVVDIEWNYSPRARNDEGDPYLRFQRDGMTVTMDADDAPETIAALDAVSSAKAGDAVAFTLEREAGPIACTGTAIDRTHAAGNCRFDPDADFVAGLAARGLHPEEAEDLLGLAFVDARLASIDELSRQGMPVVDVDELMAVAALEVTAAYLVELRSAGLEPEDVDELVAARAVGVEPGWLAEMAEAGYAGLDLEKAIELRALGVTPDYARRMARVIRAMDGVE